MKKLFSSGALMLIVLTGGIMTGCEKNSDEINFTVGFKSMDYELGQDLEIIVNTFDEWDILKPDYAMVTEFDKYNKQFFVNNSLIVYAFTRGSGGGQVEVTKVSKRGNELIVDVIHSDGVIDVVTYGIIIVEVKKTEIAGTNSLRIASND